MTKDTKHLAHRALANAMLAVREENLKRACWYCLDAAWFLVAGNKEAQEKIKLASNFIYPKIKRETPGEFPRQNLIEKRKKNG